MKQTNNAIKFLMAQYRAIFKNAYFKGLTSAVLLTAGLAVAGGAQATTLTTADLPTDGKPVTINGTTNTNIFENSISNSITNLNGQLNINSGGLGNTDSSDNLLQNKGASSTVELKGQNFGLTINAATGKQAKDVGLGLIVNSDSANKDFSIDIGSLTVQKGSLAMAINRTNKSGDITFTADEITIGTGATISATGNNSEDNIAAKVILGADFGASNSFGAAQDASGGIITFGNAYTAVAGGNPAQAASVTTLNKSGIIEFLGTSAQASKVVFAGQLVGKGGKLDFSSGSGQIKAYGTDVNANVVVGADQTAQVLLDTDKTETKDVNENLLQFTSGTIDVQGKGTAGTSGGTLLISGGTFAVEL